MNKNHIGVTIHAIENRSNENIPHAHMDNYFDSECMAIKNKVTTSLVDREKNTDSHTMQH